MNIVQWVFQDLGTKGAQVSCVEEHQRYRKPFKGLSLNQWFVAMQRLKYTDIVSGSVFNQDDEPA